MNANSFTNWLCRHYRFTIATLALFLIFYHLFMVFKFGVTTIDGTTYFLVDDDVMISMRYGLNLAEGIGLVYNAGEHVEGFTNPLLTLMAAGLHLTPVGLPLLPFFLQLFNLLLSLVIMFVLLRFWGPDQPGIAAGIMAAAFYLTLPNHAYYAHAGFEVYMIMAVLLYSIWRIESFGFFDAFILGLLPLTHGTMLPAWGTLVVIMFVVNRGSLKKRFLLAVIAVLPFLGYEIFRIMYYHDILPNTYWLKAGSGSLKGGLKYVFGWARTVWPLGILASYPLITLKNKKAIIIGVVLIVHAIGIIGLGGDIFPQYRFLFPCSVLLAALAGYAVVDLTARLVELPRLEAVYFGVLLTGLLAYMLVALPITNYQKSAGEYYAHVRWNTRHIATGIAIQENTPVTATVGLFGLGYTGYYGSRVTIDMLGKADSHIAKVKPIPPLLIGHNKIDFDYVLSKRQPDYIELGCPPDKLSDLDLLSKKTHNIWGYSAYLALHPVFRTIYAAQPVYERSGRFGNFYARSKSENLSWRISKDFFINAESKSFWEN